MREGPADRETGGPTDLDAERYLAARARRLKALDAISLIVDLPIMVGVVWFCARAFRAGHAGDRFRTPLAAGSASIVDFAVIMGVAIAAVLAAGVWRLFSRRKDVR